MPTSEFTFSQEFSYSEMFSASKKFTYSNYFTKSSDFSLSEGFTKSDAFSQSSKFSDSQFFTKSDKFSQSNGFSESFYFTYSGKFTKSIQFSPSGEFSESNDFSKSEKFTKTDKFSNSLQFSPTNALTKSNAFTSSEVFTKTDSFTASSTFLPQDPVCVAYVEDQSITLYNRCNYTGTPEKQATIEILKSNFSGYHERDEGAAIRIIDSGFICNNTIFVDCTSEEGSGGAIYIKNKVCYEHNITIKNSSFLHIRALYGGGLCIYSSYDRCYVNILHCEFNANYATAPKPKDKNDNRFGGSSAYLTAKNCFVNQTKFIKGIGEGGSVKINNKFDSDFECPESKRVLQLNGEIKNSISIFGCDFDNQNKATDSISYVGGNDKIDVDISNCNFKGKLAKGDHYINGKLTSKNSSKFNVNDCSFETNDDKSVNIEMIDDDLAIDLINSNSKDFNSAQDNLWKNYSILFLLISGISIYILRSKKRNDREKIKDNFGGIDKLFD